MFSQYTPLQGHQLALSSQLISLITREKAAPSVCLIEESERGGHSVDKINNRTEDEALAFS